MAMNCACCPDEADARVASLLDAQLRPLCNRCIEHATEPADVLMAYVRNSGLLWAEMPEHVRERVTAWAGDGRIGFAEWLRRQHRQLSLRHDAEWLEEQDYEARMQAVLRKLPHYQPRRPGRLTRAAAAVLPMLLHWSTRS